VLSRRWILHERAPIGGAKTSLRQRIPSETSERFHGSGLHRKPIAANSPTSRTSSIDPIRTWMSMQSLADRPGTDVEPT
jgi:hypothetical protein